MRQSVNNSGKKRDKAGVKLYIILPSVIVLTIAILFVTWSAIVPLKKIKSFNEEYSSTENQNPCYDQPALSNEIRELTYLTAFDEMAKSDSIGLVINLADSTAMLAIKGVVIHSAKIHAISNDGFLKSMNICSYQNLFSRPIAILSQNATIEKEPIQIKKAPKNEEEALANAEHPDTTKTIQVTDIHFKLAIGCNFFIHDASVGCEKANKSLSTPGEIWKNMKRFIVFKEPEYEPAIHICIDNKDAISIYRGLPARGQIILRM